MPDESPRTTEYREDEAPPVGAAQLDVVRGGPVGTKFHVKAAALIGRDEAADVSIPVEGVSRKHARLRRDSNGALAIDDLASRNGTFLNGRRIQTAFVRHGDELRIGPVALRVSFASAESSPDAAHLDLRPREREVAGWVAEGLTNAQVAKKLGISPATVGRHLANVYERLGISSRAALTKLVVSASTKT